MVDDYKISFIVCSNSKIWLEEAVHYIEHLHVPSGYNCELIVIDDANSMCGGYSEAMEYSDAKYKVYLHQDVFVINKFFLDDILSIFLSDERIGMIGMYGYDNIANDGVMWHGIGKGNLYKGTKESNAYDRGKYRYDLQRDGFSDVAEIDGFLMATQYDFTWNYGLEGWHFYDAYHSMECWKKGLRVVVPNQLFPWCIHDDSKILNLAGYNASRKRFMQDYKSFLGKDVSVIKGKYGIN